VDDLAQPTQSLAHKRYWAFISYSNQDEVIAGWLHRALETYVLPRRLVGRETRFGAAPRRLRPIFRDREELTADADLLDRVDDALRDSAYLIVVCSPAAARSAWVEEEIVRFKTVNGAERVLAVIVDGEPWMSQVPGREADECFPASLRVRVAPDGALSKERVDPIAADLRPGKDGKRLVRLKLVARMLEVGLDDLVQREAQRRQSQFAALAASGFAVAAVTGGLAIAALAAGAEARKERGQAEALVEFMLVDLRKKLEPEGRLDVLDAVASRALGYYGSQRRADMDADALGRRARVLHLLGAIDDKRGELAAALKTFQEAQATTAELLAREPDNPQRIFEHAQSVFWVGYIADRRGQEPAAEAQFRQYKALADRLVAIDPNSDAWRTEVGYANSNLGTLLLHEGRADAAAEAFSKALAMSRLHMRGAPGDRDAADDLAQSYANLSDADRARGRLDDALRERQAERAIYQAILKDRPNDNEAAEALLVETQATADILKMKGQVRRSVTELVDAVAKSDRLTGVAPDNTDFLQQSVLLREALAQDDLELGDRAGAKAAADAALNLSLKLVKKDPSVADWNGPLLGCARVLQIKIAADGAATLTARSAALAAAVAETQRLNRLLLGRTTNVPLARLDAEASLLAGDYESLRGDAAGARSYWSSAVDRLQHLGFDQKSRAGQRGQIVLAVAKARLGQPLGDALNGRFDAPWRASNAAASIAASPYTW
jgi:tetratricopeptide (TPR) repeat protein